MDKLEAMGIFKRTAELLSFTAAAEDLGLPKAKVSGAVQQLENALGTRLFHRTTRRVQLTADGQRYLSGCNGLLLDLAALEARVSGNRDITGQLRVDMNVRMATKLVIPQLPEFLQRYPGISLELSSVDYFVDPVREGFDCVVRVGGLVDSSLVAQPLGELEFINCASRGYLDRYGTPLSPDDMAAHKVVDYGAQFGARGAVWEYWDGQRNCELAVAYSVRVNNVEAYRAACMAGLGIAQLPRQAVREVLASGELVEILPAYSAGALPVSLVYPNRKNLPRKLRVFMVWLSEVIQVYLQQDAGTTPAL